MGKILGIVVVLAAAIAGMAWWLNSGSGRIDDDHDRIVGANSTEAARAGANPTATKTLTIAWAAWQPSEVLEAMAKEWGAANGVEVKLTQIPWPDYADKIYQNVFTAKGSTYDIVVGDSQWLGQGAEEGHYVEVTDFLKARPNLAEYSKEALAAFCEYPAGSKRYYAAPCEVDALGFAYRKDLFEDAKEKEAFKAKYARDLAVPKTWAELKDIADFFQRPDKSLYGVALFTDSGQYDAITMGFQTVMWAWGGAYADPATGKVDGVINAQPGVDALQFYCDLCKSTPPGSTNYYFAQSLKAFQSGQVAMAVNYFALMPSLVSEKDNPYAKVTGYFACPAGPGGRYASLGGQGISLVKYVAPEQQELAKTFTAWFLETKQQKTWATNVGCFSANTEATKGDAFLKAAPFNAAFAESLPILRDFYDIPEYAQLQAVTQKHWNAAVVGSETPKAAMDAVAKEHEAILRKAGRLK